jgi:HEPN domain-containing protein
MNSEPPDFETYSRSEEFRRFLERQLEFVDKILSKSEEAIHARPMLASMSFVEECIVGPDDKPPPDYLEQEWFGRILAISTRWYSKRYGKDLLKSPDHFTPAVVSVFGTPFRVSVPSLPTAPGKESGTAVVYFAREVLNHEEPLDWVVPRLDLAGHSDQVASEVRQHVRTICNLTRKMEWGLMFAVLERGKPSDQCQSVLGHFEKGVADICAGRHGSAVWEFHLAAEKVLKVFLAQRRISPIPRTHDLADLIQRALENGLPPTKDFKVQLMPNDAEAIQHRYSELPEPSLPRIMEIYETALQLVGHVAGALDHHDIGQRDVVYLRALPWHPSRKKDSKAPTETTDV